MRVKNILLLCFCLIAFVQCNDNDEYYDEPGWLEGPLYQVLEKEGRFSNYLKCVDRTNYALVIKSGGLYTLFAPNDEAFSIYLAEKGYASVDDIPEKEVNAIVAYSMVTSRWEESHLGDSFDPDEKVYMPGFGVKKRTNYYTSVYKEPDAIADGWVVDQNRADGSNFTMQSDGLSVYNNFKHKYMPVFMSSYFNNLSLSANDYNTFFPDVEYVGRNVYGGRLLETDMVARNGIAHEVSAVLYPLDNMDKELDLPEYASFKNLLEYKDIAGNSVYKLYYEDANATTAYKKLNSEVNKVYVKYYNNYYPNGLYFSPNYEIYEGNLTTNESEGYTMLVPTNEVLDDYIQNKLLKYYNSLHELPAGVLSSFINAHFVDGLIWPSLFPAAKNATGEYLNAEGNGGPAFEESGILSKRIKSNGFVYLVDHVVKSKFFETVFAEIILNPDFSMLNTAYSNYYANSLREDLMRGQLNGYPTNRYTVLLPSDALLTEDGYTTSYDGTNTSFRNSLIPSGVGSADDRLKRIIRMGLFKGYANGEFNSMVDSFEGDVNNALGYNRWGFRVSEYGDLIRFKNNQIQAVGNIEDGSFVTVTPWAEYENGLVFTIDKLPQFSPRWTQSNVDAGWKSKSLWEYMDQARSENTNVSTFVNYVQACLKDPETTELTGINEENYYTILMINNTSMNQAATAGLIPTLAEITADPTKAEIGANFLRAHFLQGRVYADDGLDYLYPYNYLSPNLDLPSTMLRINDEEAGLINQRTYVSVSKGANNVLSILPQKVEVGGKTVVNTSKSRNVRLIRGSVNAANPDRFRSNRMAGRSVLHEINGYLAYEVVK
ncbi:hypothetical protein D0T53_09335 [Dysgonomonas sp. 216]|uniref:fasciclin domain-containing protein n=1 Tax=Dysgonomonas sp. 216 TaxID=2302934 RepID=UPI0013D2E9E0|nr:fasciclin domain-containing protein [Dysgonomonas sp. 216]NDW19115.1 hypothetical protein [Dysgonomonas sp. 216]